jgi:hypothetical protein
MTRFTVVLLGVMLMPIAASAQMGQGGGMGNMNMGGMKHMEDKNNPVTSAIRSSVEEKANYLVESAEEMPADKYGYHPTPEQMTFGKLLSHIIGEDTFLCSKISGTPVPQMEKVTDTDPKDKIVAAIKTSTDFCVQSLGKVNDSQLGEEISVFGGHMATRASAMVDLATDLADHYSLAATELRMNGLLPPSAKHGMH